MRDVEAGQLAGLREGVAGQAGDLVVTEVQPHQAGAVVQPAGGQRAELVTGEREAVQIVQTGESEG